MTQDPYKAPELTYRQAAELGEKLLRFRDRLPAGQRKTLNKLIGGSIAADNFIKRMPSGSKEAQSFSCALTMFENGLPPEQRAGFTAMLSAGALAWGLADDAPPEDDIKPIYFWHWVHLARTAAVIITGAITIVIEATGDDEEVIVPDIELPDIPH